jgi:ribosomal protein L20
MTRGGPAKRYVKRAKVFALTKGFRGKARNCYSIAVRAAQKALQHAYRGRKLKKREMRKVTRLFGYQSIISFSCGYNGSILDQENMT